MVLVFPAAVANVVAAALPLFVGALYAILAAAGGCGTVWLFLVELL